MSPELSQLDAGVQLRDLFADMEFQRREKKPRVANRESIALRRLSRLFAEKPEAVLQELVNTAVELCGANSAGIRLEEPEQRSFRWVVIAGSLERYLDGRTPRFYRPCGAGLDSGKPQLYSVSHPYYDDLGVVAAPTLDGLVIPWSNEFMRGTLWAVSHESNEAFCYDDYVLLSSLADFAAIILRHQHQLALLQQSEHALGVAEMAHRMAHRINNPLQRLTNTIFLARRGGADLETHLAQAEEDLKQLSDQVAKLLHTAELYKPGDEAKKFTGGSVDQLGQARAGQDK